MDPEVRRLITEAAEVALIRGDTSAARDLLNALHIPPPPPPHGECRLGRGILPRGGPHGGVVLQGVGPRGGLVLQGGGPHGGIVLQGGADVNRFIRAGGAEDPDILRARRRQSGQRRQPDPEEDNGCMVDRCPLEAVPVLLANNSRARFCGKHLDVYLKAHPDLEGARCIIPRCENQAPRDGYHLIRQEPCMMCGKHTMVR